MRRIRLVQISFVSPTALYTLILTGALLLGLLLTGCGPKPTPTPTPTKTPLPPALATPTPTVTMTAAPKPTATDTYTPEPTATPTLMTPTTTPFVLVTPGPDINPLTGLKVDPQKLERRPLGVKIPNYPLDARPQSGLSFADVVIEHEAEAYLSRFTAIFWGNDANPELGPVRSLRLIDGELAPIFKAVLVASGGHPDVKTRITEGKEWAAGYQRLIVPDPPFQGSNAFRRVAKEGRRYELTMYTDTDTLWKICADRGINERPDFGEMWIFSELPPEGGEEAVYAKIVYKADIIEVEYRYDAESKTYKRFDNREPLIDELNQAQIAPSNVLVIYVNHVDTDIAADLHDPEHPWYAVSQQLWGEGAAKLLRDGRVYSAKWIRIDPQGAQDRLTIVDDQGKQIPFKPGATWIQLVRLDANVEIKPTVPEP